LAQVGGALLNLVILPVYIFLILWYKKLIIEFIHKLFSEERHQKIAQILKESQRVIQSYLVGLLFEVSIVAGLNITGLLIIGVDYALLFGLLGAILNLIPYVGIIIAALLPIGFALILQSPQHALFVVILYAVVQFVDNNIIVPRVVASKVRLNALVSILAVLVGGTLWGISGMFLSIPLVAIAKVIFDKIEELEPWGFILGDEIPNDENATIKEEISIK
jgi:predicted PurR-regulated permease PerM